MITRSKGAPKNVPQGNKTNQKATKNASPKKPVRKTQNERSIALKKAADDLILTAPAKEIDARNLFSTDDDADGNFPLYQKGWEEEEEEEEDISIPILAPRYEYDSSDEEEEDDGKNLTCDLEDELNEIYISNTPVKDKESGNEKSIDDLLKSIEKHQKEHSSDLPPMNKTTTGNSADYSSRQNKLERRFIEFLSKCKFIFI